MLANNPKVVFKKMRKKSLSLQLSFAKFAILLYLPFFKIPSYPKKRFYYVYSVFEYKVMVF